MKTKEKEKEDLTRSTKSSINQTNIGKLDFLSIFIAEYKIVTQFFVDLLWTQKKVPKKPNKSIYSQARTWLSARAAQCAAIQASGIIRSIRTKQRKRLAKIKQLTKEGKHKQSRKLQKYHDSCIESKPELQTVHPELNANCAKIDFSQQSSFDGWVILSSLAKIKSEHEGKQIKIPFRKHKHFNELNEKATLRSGIAISPKWIKFIFKLNKPTQVTEGAIVGIDIGQIDTITCSNGQVIKTDPHGHNFQSICNDLARKQKGSKGFEKKVQHRTNYVNWSVKQLNLNGVKQVNIENMKNYKIGQRTSRKLVHWTSSELLKKLKSESTEAGVLVVELDPTYTSQRCSECGWVCKKNRKRKKFICVKCGFSADADKNGSLNISLPLVALPRDERFRKRNRDGFYWRLVKDRSV